MRSDEIKRYMTEAGMDPRKTALASHGHVLAGTIVLLTTFRGGEVYTQPYIAAFLAHKWHIPKRDALRLVNPHRRQELKEILKGKFAWREAQLYDCGEPRKYKQKRVPVD